MEVEKKLFLQQYYIQTICYIYRVSSVYYYYMIIKMNFIIEEHAKEVVNSFVAVFNTSEESYTTSELYYDPSVRVLSVALPEAFRNELAQYNVSTSFTALLNCVLNNVSYPVASLEFVKGNEGDCNYTKIIFVWVVPSNKSL
eukprot:TRINITY_DN36851_c0_g1_i1.p1 TRINITY_DN36851_c0_g1~~TRINITY_DN36851_c0_g1_i1.p1  ORF type:complete len:142 (-),score=8.31 TRINITY_DN36851_c0_g1_i1:165-590(-)